MSLRLCTDLAPAAWLSEGGQPWRRLVLFGPAGFAAYARLQLPPYPASPEGSEEDVTHPSGAVSDNDLLQSALDVLARHTTSPEQCYFFLWDGYGAVLDAPKVEVPNRAYYLLQGALRDYRDSGSDQLWPTGPAFVWPADRAWCVARDVDSDWAGIGADRAAIDKLVADPRLDVVLLAGLEPRRRS